MDQLLKHIASDCPIKHQKELILLLLLNYFNVQTNCSDIRLRNHRLHLTFIVLMQNLPKLVIKTTSTANIDYRHTLYRL